MHVAAVLKRKGSDIVSVGPDEAIAAVARTLAERRIGAALVVDGGRPVGILSERDIVRGVAGQGSAVLQQPASTLMTRDLVTCQPCDTVAQVMALMSERRVRHLPVMDGERICGIVSLRDLTRSMAQEPA